MKRRGFLKSLLGVAALAAHAKFGSLVPVAEPEFTELLAPGLFTVDLNEVPLFKTGDIVSIEGYKFTEVMRITAIDTRNGVITIERGRQ